MKRKGIGFCFPHGEKRSGYYWIWDQGDNVAKVLIFQQWYEGRVVSCNKRHAFNATFDLGLGIINPRPLVVPVEKLSVEVWESMGDIDLDWSAYRLRSWFHVRMLFANDLKMAVLSPRVRDESELMRHDAETKSVVPELLT
jgi:hypothetical protein